MPKEFQYLRVCLKTEQYRLLDWAHVAQLDVQDEGLLISNASKGLLIDVLDQQDRLLKRFGRFDDRYQLLRRPLISDDLDENGEVAERPTSPTEKAGTALVRAESSFQSRFPQSEVLLKKALEWAKSSRTYPARLRWASWDKERVEGLIRKLSALNDFMRELLNSTQLQSLAIKQTRTEFQIMQLNGKMDQLVQIFESTMILGQSRARVPTDALGAFLQARGFTDSTYESAPREKNNTTMHNLAALAQAKALNLTIEDENLLTDSLAKDLELGRSASEIKSVELSRADIHILDKESDDSLAESQRVEAYYSARSGPRRIRQQVWIEWKTYDPLSFNGAPDPKILERIRALATLLKENNRTEQFRAPHCLGYFHDIDQATGEDRCRFGLVFEKPSGVHPSTRPISLLDLLRDQSAEMPSLTERITLMARVAECLERLHAVNWLHKGLRSHNILFFPESSSSTAGSMSDLIDSIDFSQPYISGFDYSRPAQNEDLTEKPPENAAYDLYRHPRVQGSGNRDPPAGAHGGSGGGSGQSAQSGYKKSYDLYSLGVILLEIAYWSPIDIILSIHDLHNTRPSTTIRVRQRLLKEGFLGFVKSRLGNTVEGVVRSCLEGPVALGVGDDEDQRVEVVGARLQRGFFDKVVGKLQGIRV
jgi:hypothetical protein